MKTLPTLVFAVLLSCAGATAQSGPINAVGLLGQTSYTSNLKNAGGAISGSGFSAVSSLALDADNHRLFVVDAGNFRVLWFNLDPNNNIASTSAAGVLGACSMTVKGSAGPTARTFSGLNIVYDPVHEYLFLSDANNSRVLGFNVAPGYLANCESASVVFGQPNFGTKTASMGQSGLDIPDDIDIDTADNLLFVSDYSSNRVMAFSTANLSSASNGENAVFELGQADFSSGGCGVGGVGGCGAQNGIKNPTGESWDATDRWLFVSDSSGRVMVFYIPNNPTSTINGENAIYVLGESGFTGQALPLGQAAMGPPDDSNYDPVRQTFCVTQGPFMRDACFDVRPSVITNGELATSVLDQSGWTSYQSGIGQSLFNQPEWAHAMDVKNNIEYVYEKYGTRVVEFSFVSITTTALVGFIPGVPYSEGFLIAQQQGASQTYSIVSGSLPTGMTLDSGTGVISGTNSDGNGANFTIEVDDNFPAGYFFDRKTFTLNPSGCAG